jgi:mannose-6-phosphate isomerase-like protein (cupin superfamily)
MAVIAEYEPCDGRVQGFIVRQSTEGSVARGDDALTQYVFDGREVIRYRFPTHTNDLIMDRRDGAASEAFFVILEPGEAPPLHVHRDAEQVFFVLEGEATMTIGRDQPQSVPLRAGNFVRTPPGTWHAVRCTSPGRFVYLSIDCFTAGPPAAEPTWDSHVRVMCAENGWDFDAVRLGAVTDGSGALDTPEESDPSRP